MAGRPPSKNATLTKVEGGTGKSGRSAKNSLHRTGAFASAPWPPLSFSQKSDATPGHLWASGGPNAMKPLRPHVVAAMLLAGAGAVSSFGAAPPPQPSQSAANQPEENNKSTSGKW